MSAALEDARDAWNELLEAAENCMGSCLGCCAEGDDEHDTQCPVVRLETALSTMERDADADGT